MPKHPRLHRLNVYLEKPQVKKLKAVAKSDKISESAVVRKGIDMLPDPRRDKSNDTGESHSHANEGY